MEILEKIRATLREIKTEAYGENRPHIIRKHVDDMVSAYTELTNLDLSGQNREKNLNMVASVASLKRFLEMGELDQVGLRLRSMVSAYI